MKSVDELRKWANGLSGIWIDPNDHSIIVTTCDDMPPSMDCVSLHEHVSGILDEIDAEYQKTVDEWKAKDGQTWLHGYGECHTELLEGNEGITVDLEKAGWVKLPVDADGVPWHVGDMTENGNVVNGMTIDFHGWHFTGTRNDIDPAIHRHYVPKPTVEDVLREFADRYLDYEGIPSAGRRGIGEALMAEYAAKLRLAGDGE